jgi:arginyl-tRNA synthetase
MKNTLKNLIRLSLERAVEKGQLIDGAIPDIEVEAPKVEAHGDFSTNIAMVMASSQKMAPRKIAEAIIANLEDSGQMIAKTEIAGPGFINFL